MIIAFGVVAFSSAQRATPSTGGDAGQVALGTTSSSSASASASASPSAAATPSASATVSQVNKPTAAPIAPGHGVLLDKALPSGNPTWESPSFKAPSAWTISYAYDCGGYGGHFTVAVFSDLLQTSPVQKRGDRGSGTATVNEGGTVTLAIDTTRDCSWHVTARG